MKKNWKHQKRKLGKLKTKLTKEFILIIQCDESRSQHKNKELVIKRFLELIINGLKVPKKRKATKPSKSSIRKRLEKKKKQAFKKVFRLPEDVNPEEVTANMKSGVLTLTINKKEKVQPKKIRVNIN